MRIEQHVGDAAFLLEIYGQTTLSRVTLSFDDYSSDHCPFSALFLEVDLQ